MKTLHIPHFWILHKIKYYLQYFTNCFTIIYNFILLSSKKCLLHASCCTRIFSSQELKIWDFFTSRAMLHFLYSSMLITNLCTKAVTWEYSIDVLTRSSWISSFEISSFARTSAFIFNNCLQVSGRRHKDLGVHLQD